MRARACVCVCACVCARVRVCARACVSRTSQGVEGAQVAFHFRDAVQAIVLPIRLAVPRARAAEVLVGAISHLGRRGRVHGAAVPVIGPEAPLKCAAHIRKSQCPSTITV